MKYSPLCPNIFRRLCTAVLAVVLLGILSVPASAELRHGEKTFGIKAGYVSQNESALAGLFFQYSFSKHFRISPEVDVLFRNKDLAALNVDANAHVTFGFENDKVALYPLAGLNFSSWSRYDHDADRDVDVTTHINRFGANLGGGVELRCTSTLKVNLEAKYTFIKTYSGAAVSLGISYVF